MTTSNKRIKRTCSNCAAYSLDEADGLITCWNLVTIVIHHVDAQGKPLTIKRQPGPRDHCDGHQTDAEDKAADAALALFWQRLSIEPGMGRNAL